jgi:hypothetical protein
MKIHVLIQTHNTEKALFISEILIVKTQEGTHHHKPKIQNKPQRSEVHYLPYQMTIITRGALPTQTLRSFIRMKATLP